MRIEREKVASGRVGKKDNAEALSCQRDAEEGDKA